MFSCLGVFVHLVWSQFDYAFPVSDVISSRCSRLANNLLVLLNNWFLVLGILWNNWIEWSQLDEFIFFYFPSFRIYADETFMYRHWFQFCYGELWPHYVKSWIICVKCRFADVMRTLRTSKKITKNAGWQDLMLSYPDFTLFRRTYAM